MKKFLLSAVVLGGFVSANAQAWVHDSVVVGNTYKNRVFYSLNDGEKSRYDDFGTEADLIIPTGSMTQEIFTAYGTTLFEVKGSAGDTSNWAALTISDPSTIVDGPAYAELNNDPTKYANSSFANGSAQYGWGIYSGPPLHQVIGTRIFLIKTSAGTWKKMWVINQAGSQSTSTLNIRFANLDGTGQVNRAVLKTQAGKNFVYYDIDGDVRKDVEPNAGTYDLVFTRWKTNLGTWMAVSGVINAPGVYSSKVSGLSAAAAESALFEDHPIVDSSITVIGDGWKGLSGPGYVVWDSLTYFIADASSNIWQLSFTKFKTGSGANIGEYVFKKRKIATASIEENESVSAWTVFPNPAADFVSVVFNSSKSDMGQFNLLDLNGRQVMTENIPMTAGLNQYSIDLASRNLPTGIYVATLRAGNVLKTTKLIIR